MPQSWCCHRSDNTPLQYRCIKFFSWHFVHKCVIFSNLWCSFKYFPAPLTNFWSSPVSYSIHHNTSTKQAIDFFLSLVLNSSVSVSRYNCSASTDKEINNCEGGDYFFFLISICFGDLGVACWSLVPKFAGSNLAEAVRFLGRKNPQHAFLWRGSKAVGPMS